MTNPLKTEHAIDWRKTAQEIEDQFQAGMIERDRYRNALEDIANGRFSGIEALEAKVKELEIVVLGRNAVIATLENKLAESRVALHKYGKHIDGCTYGIPQPRFCENPCTCGLRDLLN